MQRQKLVTVDVATFVRLAAGKRPEARVWTDERVAEWRSRYELATDGMRLSPVHLITFRGLRRGEAAGLRWVDVGLDRAVVSIQTQLVQIGWSVRESTPKSEASDALVALDQATVTAL